MVPCTIACMVAANSPSIPTPLSTSPKNEDNADLPGRLGRGLPGKSALSSFFGGDESGVGMLGEFAATMRHPSQRMARNRTATDSALDRGGCGRYSTCTRSCRHGRCWGPVALCCRGGGSGREAQCGYTRRGRQTGKDRTKGWGGGRGTDCEEGAEL
jgi:hypothetical protein